MTDKYLRPSEEVMLQRHQDTLQWAQHERLVREAKPAAQAKRQAFAPLRAILATLLHLMTR